MAKQVVSLTESQLKEMVKESVKMVIDEEAALKLDYEYNPIGPLCEMARINMNEEGNKYLFPSNVWEIKIWSSDHNPPHFHIKSKGWNVSFNIETGDVIGILTRGTEKNVYDYMCANVKKWLESPCAILPQITNKQNATLQWVQIHG